MPREESGEKATQFFTGDARKETTQKQNEAYKTICSDNNYILILRQLQNIEIKLPKIRVTAKSGQKEWLAQHSIDIRNQNKQQVLIGSEKTYKYFL